VFGKLKRYTSLALCALLLNIALLFPAHAMVAQQVSSQDKATQSVETSAEDNQQSDKKEIKKSTMRESWRKVVTLRWKELSRADAWNIGAPLASITGLGLLSRYFPKGNIADNPGNHNPGIPPLIPGNGRDFGENINNNPNNLNPDINNPILTSNDNTDDSLLAGVNKLAREIQANIALPIISGFLFKPKSLVGHTGGINSVATSGNMMVTASADMTAKIWNMDTHEVVHTLVGHTDAVNSVAIYGDKVVTGSDDGTAKIWDIQGKFLWVYKSFGERVTAVAINRDNAVIKFVDGTVQVWDIKTNRSLYITHANNAQAIAISDNIMAIGSYDGTITTYRINDGQLLSTFKEHTNEVVAIALSGNKMVTSSYDRTVKIWDIYTGECLFTLLTGHNGHTAAVTSMAINGEKLVTGSWDRRVKIWNINTGEILFALPATNRFDTEVESVAISNDKVVIGLGDNTAQIWSLSIDLSAQDFNNLEEPLAWIRYNLTIPQADFIARALNATQAGQDFIIALPEKLGEIKENESQEQADGRIYFTFPDEVREYLRTRLMIRK